MSNYKPMTADEAAKLSLRPEGLYAFDVATAESKTSKTGNPMIALSLNFFDAEGDRFSVKDWLVHSDSRWAEKKCYDFAYAVGIEAAYSAGTMTAEDCLGRSGFAFVNIQKGKAKEDGSGNFPDRNGVKYYTKNGPKKEGVQADAPTGEPGTTPLVRNAAVEEDVPF